jgi:enoyl-CoA hydratase/carnithine racemase
MRADGTVSTMAENFLFEKDGPISTITFNRPERRNCLNREVILQFEKLLQDVRDDRATRVLIVTGAGTTFCAGADTSALKGVTDPKEQRRIFNGTGGKWPRLIGRAFDVLANLDQVTIGAINGHAVGGGWSFALAFDFAIAVEEAEFWVPEVDLDVPYRGLPAIVLSHRLGPWRAKEAILLCRRYRAAELLEMGVLNRVVTREVLMESARELAAAMARKPQAAIAASKRGINGVFFGQRQF